MKYKIISIYIALTIGFVSSASAAEKFFQAKDRLPKLAQNKVRLFIYRMRKFGVLSHPNVVLDNKMVWESESGAVKYLDIDPGKHTITISGNRFSFFSKSGETKFINLGVKPGDWTNTFNPQLVSRQYGESNIHDLDLVGL